MGAPADSGRVGVLLPQLVAGPHGRVLSRSGRRHGVRAGSVRMERYRRRRSAGGHAGRRHRGAARARARRRRATARSAIWSPSTPAMSSSAGCECCGAASTAARRSASSSTNSSITSHRRGKVVARVTESDVRRPRSFAGTVRGDAGADRAGRHRRGRRRSGARDRAALPGPHRTAAARLHRRRGRRADRSVRTSRTLGHHPTHFLWLHTTAMVQGFTGTTQVDLPLECTYDFEVAASKYLHALRDGDDPAAIPVQRNGFHQGRAGLLGAAGAVGPRRPLRHAGLGVA